MSILGKLNKVRKKPDQGEKEMSFLDHLEELRWHLVRSFLAIVFFGIWIFVFINRVVENVILWPLRGDFPLNRLLCKMDETLCFDMLDVQLIATKPTEMFMKSITISLAGGFIIAFPYFFWEMWRFIRPGLHKDERRGLRGNVFVVSMLFFIGVAFGYFIISPFSMQFFANYKLADSVENYWTIGYVVLLVTQIALAGGIFFQMPVVVYYLSKMGIVTPELMKTYRKHAIVVLLVLAAIITPPDPQSQVLIFFPLLGLYEISISISRRVNKKRDAELAA